MCYLQQSGIAQSSIKKKMEEPQAGFMEAHLCGILFVIAGLPQISFIAPGLFGVK